MQFSGDTAGGGGELGELSQQAFRGDGILHSSELALERAQPSERRLPSLRIENFDRVAEPLGSDAELMKFTGLTGGGRLAACLEELGDGYREIGHRFTGVVRPFAPTGGAILLQQPAKIAAELACRAVPLSGEVDEGGIGGRQTKAAQEAAGDVAVTHSGGIAADGTEFTAQPAGLGHVLPGKTERFGGAADGNPDVMHGVLPGVRGHAFQFPGEAIQSGGQYTHALMI